MVKSINCSTVRKGFDTQLSQEGSQVLQVSVISVPGIEHPLLASAGTRQRLGGEIHTGQNTCTPKIKTKVQKVKSCVNLLGYRYWNPAFEQ